MKIYTKTGDKGSTSLWGGKRISKGELRIEAYGTIDELNAHLGLVLDLETEKPIKELLISVQNTLFLCGSLLAADPENQKLALPPFSDELIPTLEKAIDELDKQLEPMTAFILPSGHPTVSHTHIARTICRRAERRCVALSEIELVNPLIIQFLNRLSDYLFTLARYQGKRLNATEIPWNP